MPVIEDDPYGRLRYSGAEAPALSALPGGHGRIYLGTLSKILSPGLRLAWLVAPDRALYERPRQRRNRRRICTRLPSRSAWPGVIFASRESCLRILAALRQAYGRRRDRHAARPGAASARRLPLDAARWRPFPLGRGPAGDRHHRAADGSLMAQKVAFVPGAPFWVGRAVRNTLRLNFSNATEERIEEGVRRLGDAIRAAESLHLPPAQLAPASPVTLS